MVPNITFQWFDRSSATGAHNGFSKVGAACGTFLTEYLDSVQIRYSISVLVAVLVISSIATLFFQLETMGKSLKDGGDTHITSKPMTEISLQERVNKADEPHTL